MKQLCFMKKHQQTKCWSLGVFLIVIWFRQKALMPINLLNNMHLLSSESIWILIPKQTVLLADIDRRSCNKLVKSGADIKAFQHRGWSKCCTGKVDYFQAWETAIGCNIKIKQSSRSLAQELIGKSTINLCGAHENDRGRKWSIHFDQSKDIPELQFDENVSLIIMHVVWP